MYLYRYENPFNEPDGVWVLYDIENRDDGKIVPTTSHRMSKINVNVLPFEEINK